VSLRLLPLYVLCALAAFAGFGLFHAGNKNIKISPLVGTKAPAIELPAFNGKRFSSGAWEGKVVVLNFFASWCAPCALEHPELMKLAKNNIAIYGVAWKDKAGKTSEWVKERGNPYRAIGIDSARTTTILFGLTGVPETFVIDKKGMIRAHYSEPLGADKIQQELLPLVEQLEHE
jgi:cytochrome c biogenesis protein CcmG/thiol:disulfide interchange protein DsbE